jgi:hypothetical protein
VRWIWSAVAIAGLLFACTAQPTTSQQALTRATCSTGYQSRVDIRLTVADNGRSITAHLCDVIDVYLVGPPSSQWQSIQSSDESVLSIVPLPLPAPPRGGANLVFIAQATGVAVLSSVGPSSSCTKQGACPPVQWTVGVTVVN